MTAAKAQRVPETDEPEQAKAIGTPGEPKPEPLSDLPPEPIEPEPVKPAPVVTPEVKKTTTSEPPSLLARFGRWLATDLDGN